MFEFILLLGNGVETPQYVLSAESMKPLKLQRHLEANHYLHAKKDAALFRFHETGLKGQRLDATGSFHHKQVKNIAAFRNPS